jgi:hypothetical protein
MCTLISRSPPLELIIDESTSRSTVRIFGQRSSIAWWWSHTWFNISVLLQPVVDCVWNVMAHAQKPDFVFRRKGRVHLNRRGRQFSRLLAAEVCASAVVMLDTPRWGSVSVLATHSVRQFPLHFSSRASPCAIAFQLDSESWIGAQV